MTLKLKKRFCTDEYKVYFSEFYKPYLFILPLKECIIPSEVKEAGDFLEKIGIDRMDYEGFLRGVL